MTRINPIGVSTHLDTLSQSDVDKQLDLMQQAGICWIRLEFLWKSIESEQGTWTFDNYDYIVKGILTRGMRIIGLLSQYHAPAWYIGNAPWNQPPGPQDYATFTQAVAMHYQGQILLYEIGNEPNLSQFWYPQPNATAYSALLKASYPAIKVADSNAKVISAGLSASGDPNTFLAQMYASGVQGYMDYVGYHPYCNNVSPDSNASGHPFSLLATLKSTMTNNGDDNKEIIATEFGWNTSTSGVSETIQASYIQRAYQKIVYEDYQYVAIVCVYDFLDNGTDKTIPGDNFGLLHTDYSQKPAYSTMQAMANNYAANFMPINP